MLAGEKENVSGTVLTIADNLTSKQTGPTASIFQKSEAKRRRLKASK
jgi:hypothetical protein